MTELRSLISFGILLKSFDSFFFSFMGWLCFAFYKTFLRYFIQVNPLYIDTHLHRCFCLAKGLFELSLEIDIYNIKFYLLVGIGILLTYVKTQSTKTDIIS